MPPVLWTKLNLIIEFPLDVYFPVLTKGVEVLKSKEAKWRGGSVHSWGECHHIKYRFQ